MADALTTLWNELQSSDVRQQVLSGVIATLIAAAMLGMVAWAWNAWKRRPRLRLELGIRRIALLGGVEVKNVCLYATNLEADPVYVRGFYLTTYPNLFARLLRIKEQVVRMPQALGDGEHAPLDLQRGIPRRVELGQDDQVRARRGDLFCVLEQADGTMLRAQRVRSSADGGDSLG
jgi:hypothetical protein